MTEARALMVFHNSNCNLWSTMTSRQFPLIILDVNFLLIDPLVWIIKKYVRQPSTHSPISLFTLFVAYWTAPAICKANTETSDKLISFCKHISVKLEQMFVFLFVILWEIFKHSPMFWQIPQILTLICLRAQEWYY